MKAQLVMIKMKQKIQPLIRSLRFGRKEEKKKGRKEEGNEEGKED
jgi:hypothetical protein